MEQETLKMKRLLKAHYATGGALMLLAALAVGISRLPVALPVRVAAGLGVAAVMAGLVGWVFMHLGKQRSLIFRVLISAAVFFLALMSLTLLAFYDAVGRV